VAQSGGMEFLCRPALRALPWIPIGVDGLRILQLLRLRIPHSCSAHGFSCHLPFAADNGALVSFEIDSGMIDHHLPDVVSGVELVQKLQGSCRFADYTLDRFFGHIFYRCVPDIPADFFKTRDALFNGVHVSSVIRLLQGRRCSANLFL